MTETSNVDAAIAVADGASDHKETPVDTLRPMSFGREEDGVPDEVEHDPLPNGGYGWVIVASLVARSAVTWGINSSYGVYCSYYLKNNYYAGGSTMNYAWVGGLSAGAALAVAPLANWLTNVGGFKLPLWISVVCTCLGQCLAGICTSFGAFAICQGLIFGMGIGLSFIASAPVLAHWFDRRLALAQGISAAGSGLGALVFSNTTQLALDSVGVKWSLIINGLISLVVLIPCTIVLRGRHKAVKARSAPFEIKWFWHPVFLYVWISGFFTIMAYYITVYSMSSEATLGLGLTQTQGAALTSIIGAGQMIGRPLVGLLLDSAGRVNGALIAFFFAGLSSLVIWIPARSFGVLVLFAIIQGFFGGTVWSASTPLVTSAVGVSDLASALSIFWLVLVIPALVGQPIAIALLDYSTNTLGRTGPEAYFISMGFCGGVAIFSALVLYPAKVRVQGSWAVFQKA